MSSEIFILFLFSFLTVIRKLMVSHKHTVPQNEVMFMEIRLYTRNWEEIHRGLSVWCKICVVCVGVKNWLAVTIAPPYISSRLLHGSGWKVDRYRITSLTWEQNISSCPHRPPFGVQLLWALSSGLTLRFMINPLKQNSTK